MRVGHVIRPMSPRSPTASVFESMEGSDEEDNMTDSCIVDSTYLYTNEDSVRFIIIHVFSRSCYFFLVWWVIRETGFKLLWLAT